MRNYAPYLLYQVTRFGALSVPQMLKVCQDKCGRSSLYRALGELADGGLVYPILNPATRTRAYYATLEGRETVFGKHQPLTTGVKAKELDHTILCAEVLLKLCNYANVSGIATHFELGADDVKRFCHSRIPDGIIRLTQGGHDFELAVEVESSVRNASRVTEVLENYWQTFRRGMECTGLILVSMSPTITSMYSKALLQMSEELQSRAKLLEGADLIGLRTEAFGEWTDGLSRCLDLTRTSFLGEVRYSPVKSGTYLAQASCNTPTPAGVGQQIIRRSLNEELH